MGTVGHGTDQGTQQFTFVSHFIYFVDITKPWL